jgi:hypothetical protein
MEKTPSVTGEAGRGKEIVGTVCQAKGAAGALLATIVTHTNQLDAGVCLLLQARAQVGHIAMVVAGLLRLAWTRCNP